jgi:hypothetical protein
VPPAAGPPVGAIAITVGTGGKVTNDSVLPPTVPLALVADARK